MPVRAERGYLIPAINTGDVDYERCAQHLADSIRHWHPAADITIITRDMLPGEPLPGFANDWLAAGLTPYRQTIKLEADMLAAGPIDHWWTLFENRDVVISQGCRDYHDRPSPSRSYRKVFDSNDLPDVYNAITYWRLSSTAVQFWALVRKIFEDWSSFKVLLKFPDDEPSTDLVYAMAAEIMGKELVTLPAGLGPRIVHMKSRIIGCRTEDWSQELIWERSAGTLRIQTVSQWGLVHYHVKDWP